QEKRDVKNGQGGEREQTACTQDAPAGARQSAAAAEKSRNVPLESGRGLCLSGHFAHHTVCPAGVQAGFHSISSYFRPKVSQRRRRIMTLGIRGNAAFGRDGCVPAASGVSNPAAELRSPVSDSVNAEQ